MNNLYQELIALNEGYFKENSDLIQAQMWLGKLRQKYRSPQFRRNLKALQSEEKLQFEKYMARAFGLDFFTLTIEPDNIFNACTVPVYFGWDEYNLKGQIEVTPTGYRFSKDAKAFIWVIVNGPLIYDERYSDREAMAVILHEVGHNFACKNRKINFLHTIGSALNLMAGLALIFASPVFGFAFLAVNATGFNRFCLELTAFLEKNYPKLMESVYWLSHNVIGGIMNVLMEAQFVAGLFSIPGVSGIFNVVQNVLLTKIKGIGVRGFTYIMFLISGYPNDQFADGFAAMYGYGPDLSTAFVTASNATNSGLLTAEVIGKHCPVLLAWYDLITLPFIICITPFDEHPAMIERMQGNLRLLKKEASNTSDEKLKKRINQDIANIEREIDRNYNPKNVVKLTSGPAWSDVSKRLYSGLVLSLFGGDFRHHIANHVFGAQDSLTSKDDEQFRRSK